MTYCIIRFHEDAPNEIVQTGLTLTEAQAHCQDPATQGTDENGRWFDGYESEDA